MAANLTGLDAKIYYNAGSYASPTWTEIANVKDVTPSLEATDIAVANRSASGWTEHIQGLKDGEVSFSVDWDTAAAGFSNLKDAFFDSSDLEMLILDGPETTSGQEGLRATMQVLSFTRNEPLEDVLTVDVTVKPTPNSDANPEWYTS